MVSKSRWKAVSGAEFAEVVGQVARGGLRRFGCGQVTACSGEGGGGGCVGGGAGEIIADKLLLDCKNVVHACIYSLLNDLLLSALMGLAWHKSQLVLFDVIYDVVLSKSIVVGYV